MVFNYECCNTQFMSDIFHQVHADPKMSDSYMHVVIASDFQLSLWQGETVINSFWMMIFVHAILSLNSNYCMVH